MASTTSEPAAGPSKTITIGTRRSKLARIQCDIVLASMQKEFPANDYKVHAMDPLGDRDKITALYKFNAKSLWTEELEVLLENGELDLIVHSLKGLSFLPMGAWRRSRECNGE
jgi:hydroxymethylbilane synthase